MTIILDPLEAFVSGKPYDQQAFLKTLRDICDTVIRSHYRHYAPDDEMYGVAIIKLTDLLCRGKIDFSKPRRACFSFLYTTARNEIGNYLKARFQFWDRVSKMNSGPVATPYVESKAVCERMSGAAVVRVSLAREIGFVMERLRECGLEAEEVLQSQYAGLAWRTACYRATVGAGSV